MSPGSVYFTATGRGRIRATGMNAMRGVLRDRVEPVRWYRLAAEPGDGNAARTRPVTVLDRSGLLDLVARPAGIRRLV